jgi:hypothetical protein
MCSTFVPSAKVSLWERTHEPPPQVRTLPCASRALCASRLCPSSPSAPSPVFPVADLCVFVCVSSSFSFSLGDQQQPQVLVLFHSLVFPVAVANLDALRLCALCFALCARVAVFQMVRRSIWVTNKLQLWTYSKQVDPRASRL